jgi:hypothetical protein
MTRVHHVKKARKANKAYGIKKGDSYYWWAFFRGGKHISKTYPRQSQLTRSDYFSAAYGIEEGIEDFLKEKDVTAANAVTELESAIGDIESLRDETQDKFDNMPDGLQQGDTGQLLEERVNNCNSVISEVESAKDQLEELIEDDKGIAEKINDILSGITWSWE